jgi:RNA polymerase sigma-70 factor (ECF subfamily)
LNFAELYETNFKKICGLCYCQLHEWELARDVAQDAFLRAFEKIEDLRDQEKFLPWVSTIAVNIGRNLMRQRGSKNLPLEEVLDWQEYTISDAAERHENRSALRQGLLSLPMESQQVLLLKYFYCCSDEEIGRRTDLPTGTVKSRLHRGKKLLRESIKDDFPEMFRSNNNEDREENQSR